MNENKYYQNRLSQIIYQIIAFIIFILFYFISLYIFLSSYPNNLLLKYFFILSIPLYSYFFLKKLFEAFQNLQKTEYQLMLFAKDQERLERIKIENNTQPNAQKELKDFFTMAGLAKANRTLLKNGKENRIEELNIETFKSLIAEYNDFMDIKPKLDNLTKDAATLHSNQDVNLEINKYISTK